MNELSIAALAQALSDYRFGLPFFILFGLIFGSFATMASYRLPRREDLVFKQSHCPICTHKLGFFDLLPLFSWILSLGKCRHCHNKISIRYPLTELLMAGLFATIYLHIGFGLAPITMMGLSVCLVIMIVTDLEHRIIPDEIQIAILTLGIIYRFALDSEILQYFTGPLFGLLFALALRYGFYLWKKREGLGMGDVKFFAVCGMFLGIKAFIPFLFWSGVFGVIFSFFWKKINHEEEFPFGPALAASMLLCLIFPEYSVKLFYYYE